MVTRAEADPTKRTSFQFTDKADEIEYIKNTAAEEMFDKLKKMREALGKRPYEGLPVDEEERMTRYLQIRKDPGALANLIRANSKIKEDGRVLVKKELVKQLQTLEDKARKVGF